MIANKSLENVANSNTWERQCVILPSLKT
jgi:hypothetical protein